MDLRSPAASGPVVAGPQLSPANPVATGRNLSGGRLSVGKLRGPTRARLRACAEEFGGARVRRHPINKSLTKLADGPGELNLSRLL